MRGESEFASPLSCDSSIRLVGRESGQWVVEYAFYRVSSSFIPPHLCFRRPFITPRDSREAFVFVLRLHEWSVSRGLCVCGGLLFIFCPFTLSSPFPFSSLALVYILRFAFIPFCDSDGGSVPRDIVFFFLLYK